MAGISAGHAGEVEDMRIAVYKDTLANGRGADRAVLALAAGLKERGHDVQVFEKNNLAACLAGRWDVVVSTGTNELLDLAAACPSGFPWPVVQQFHTNPKSQFKRKRLIRNWKIRKALRRVAAIQVLAAAFVPQVERYGPPVSVIGNWSEDGWRAHPSRAENHAQNTIIYPAAFGKGKNHQLLIRAFSSLHDEFPDWTLELYGRGEPPSDLPSNVRCMGYQDLAEAYARCRFVAFPSLDEGFPLTLVEAAAWGKPAVSVRDWIGACAVGGGLVTESSVKAYAAGLKSLMSDVGLCSEMGARARDFCAAAYDRRRILDCWEKLLVSAANVACKTKCKSARAGEGLAP